MSDFVEHGLSVSKGQLAKLKKGGAINVKAKNIVSSADAAHRVVLGKGKSKKMMTALNKNKGFRLAVMPNEDLVAMTEGGKISLKGTVFDRRFKTPKEIKEDFGITAAEKAAKKGAKVIKKGFDEKIVESGVGKDIASQLIRTSTGTLLPGVAGFASQIMGDPTGISGNVVGSIAGDQLQRLAEKKGYGAKGRKAKNTMKAIGKVVQKIQKNPAVKDLEKQLLREGVKVAGEALSAYTGNPAAGMALERVVISGGDKLIDSGSAKKALKSSGETSSRIALEMVDDYVDNNLSGVERDVVQNALAGKYPSARDLIYDYGNSKLETLNPFSGYGVIPRKTRTGMRSMVGGRSGSSTLDKSAIFGGRMPRMVDPNAVRILKESMGGAVREMEPPSSIIQTGAPFIKRSSATFNETFIPPSPLLAKPIMGGSFRPAGGMYGGMCGGSFMPA